MTIQLAALRNAVDLTDLAQLLDVRPKDLSFALYIQPTSTRYRKFEIPKKGRGTRLITAPEPRLKYIQRQLAEFLLIVQQELEHQRTLGKGIIAIVLQARKYGLGFLVVSQRTANVTKSVLNQCNTVVSFQAFDETGFDFLKNYMGSYHVTALPTLKARHGILLGKASRSRRPLMVRFDDQQRDVRAQPAPNMPKPRLVEFGLNVQKKSQNNLGG